MLPKLIILYLLAKEVGLVLVIMVGLLGLIFIANYLVTITQNMHTLTKMILFYYFLKWNNRLKIILVWNH